MPGIIRVIRGIRVPNKKGQVYHLPYMAERLGFEPRVTPKSHNGFRDRPDQPLWHLSVRSRAIITKTHGFFNCPTAISLNRVQSRLGVAFAAAICALVK